MFEFLDHIAAHWVFIGSALVINALVALTKKVMKLAKTGDAIYSLIAHVSPIVFGLVIAFIPGLAVEGFESLWARAFFFVSVGLASTWLYRLARQYAKKNGYSLDSERPTRPSIPSER